MGFTKLLPMCSMNSMGWGWKTVNRYLHGDFIVHEAGGKPPTKTRRLTAMLDVLENRRWMEPLWNLLAS